MASETITQVLVDQAARRPSGMAFTVTDPRNRATTISYGELLDRSLRLATGLRERGLRRGDRVLICLPTCPEVLSSFYGTLLAGGVCVPVYPPLNPSGIGRWKRRVGAIARVAQPCGAIMANQGRLHMAAVLEQHGQDLFTVSSDQLMERGTGEPEVAEASDLAFIQFTSGTTRQPRGVSVTQASLMANIQALVSVMELEESDISVSWLPPYHDMGLVGHIFVPVQQAVHQHLMPPTAFVRRPVSWLQKISDTGATQTTAPNFAFSMCLRRIPAAERRGLDLSSLRQTLNGAELVQARTLEGFAEAFAPWGFSARTFRPVYGLAEATLAATFSLPGGARVDWVDRQRLARLGRARQVCEGSPGGLAVVSVGPPIPGHALRVVREGGETCAEREVGEVWFSGPSVMAGYFNNPQATAEVMRDGWLATGDLGYLADGQLYITGRKKELVIKGGRNYVPQDFEAACLQVEGVRPGRAVAFGVTNSYTGTEDLVLVAETARPDCAGNPLLSERVARAVAEHTGLRPDRVDLVRPGLLPKTTSGKFQRGKVRAAYEGGATLQGAPPSGLEAAGSSLRSALDLASARVKRALGWG